VYSTIGKIHEWIWFTFRLVPPGKMWLVEIKVSLYDDNIWLHKM